MVDEKYAVPHWYALYTRSRHEKKVDKQLLDKGIESYLPMRRIRSRWSDRKKWIDEPLFRCYVFIHVNERERLDALQTYGAVRVISFCGKPAIVQDAEISTIKMILKEIPTVESCISMSVGHKVEIARGPLMGMQGRLQQIRNEQRLVVSIDSIHQALRFNVDVMDVKVIR